VVRAFALPPVLNFALVGVTLCVIANEESLRAPFYTPGRLRDALHFGLAASCSALLTFVLFRDWNASIVAFFCLESGFALALWLEPLPEPPGEDPGDDDEPPPDDPGPWDWEAFDRARRDYERQLIPV
jgi:hypothetical protein